MVFAPLKAGDLKTKLMVNETELPDVTMTVKPTAHWLFCKLAADPMPLVLSTVPLSS